MIKFFTLIVIGLIMTGCVTTPPDKQIIGYHLFGKGPIQVIALHDWSVDAHGDYDPVKPYLDQDKFTIAFADVRGYGASKSMSGQFTSSEIANDVAQLADSLGWDQFSIVGHSMTGMAVQRVMANMPERLSSVIATVPVLASGFPVDDDTFAFFESMATNDENFKAGMSALTSGRYGEGWANAKLRQNRESVNSDAMKAYTSMWSKEDFSADVKGNETPILIIFGEHDNEGLRASANLETFQQWYPNLETHISASGHYPMQESTVDYAQVVQEYLLRTNKQ